MSRPAAIVFSLSIALVIAGCGPDVGGALGSRQPSANASPAPAQSQRGALDGCPSNQPSALPAGQTRTVTIVTRKGTFTIKVEGALSPIAAGNFVALADCGYYDGVIFHRLVPGFVIQGGDPEGTGAGGPGYTIQDEPVTTAYARGVVAMARTRQPNSQGSQFFVVLSDDARDSLSEANTYAIFGRVTSGMDVVDAIAAMPNSGDPRNTALDPVAMDTITVSTP